MAKKKNKIKRTVDDELKQLRKVAIALAKFNYGSPINQEDKFLALVIKAWVRTISSRALSIAFLLKNSDFDSALVLLRTLREKCIDLALLCSWDDLNDAALRAHIYQRLRHKQLAKKNPDIAKNPTLKNMESDLKKFKQHYPEVYSEIAKLTEQSPLRSHWSGLKPEKRLAKAAIVDPKARKVQDLLSTEVHGSLDLAAQRDSAPTMIIVTAKYVMSWVNKAAKALELLQRVRQQAH